MDPINPSIAGIVTRLEGEAFDLTDDAGRRHTFNIAIDLAVEGGTLMDLQREARRVVVVYDEETPAGLLAHRVLADGR